MIMTKESAAHKEFKKYMHTIGNHKIQTDNDFHVSLEEFRQQRISSGEDPSKDLFKYEAK